jgi:hypothetical protein
LVKKNWPIGIWSTQFLVNTAMARSYGRLTFG